MPESYLYRKFGRLAFLLLSVMVAALCGGALMLLQAHNNSPRAHLAVEFGFVLLGVFWLRCLERRLMDAGLPRWYFWPYFLIVLGACSGAHVLKIANGSQTMALFVLLQVPTVFMRGRRAAAGAESQSHKIRRARRVTPLAAYEFAVYVLLIAGLCHVMHLLRGDVSGMAHAHVLKYALDGGSAILCVLWIVCVRGRLEALGRLSWTLDYCTIVLTPCLLLFALRFASFTHAIVLFVVLQIPMVLVRRESISARFFPEDADF